MFLIRPDDCSFVLLLDCRRDEDGTGVGLDKKFGVKSFATLSQANKREAIAK